MTKQVVRKRWVGATLAAMLPLTAACTVARLGTISTRRTQAEDRIVFVAPIDLDSGNRIVPRQVVCAEPSPDISKAVSSTLSGSTAINVRGQSPNSPVEINLEQVAALSKSRVEAIAQMTERLATIQLLRDAQYRACEAYANGAITDVMYGVMISRFGDTMVTMLSEELAAGNFGRSLSTLSGTSTGSASAQKGLQAAVDELVAKQKALDDAKNQLADAQKAQGAVAADAPQADKDAAAATVTAKQQAVTDKEAELKTAQGQADIMMQASANSAAATSATGVGATTDVAKGGVELAKVLEDMQKNYLFDITAEPQIISCILALSSSRPIDDATKDTCLRSTAKLSDAGMELLKRKTENSFQLKLLQAQKELKAAEAQASKAAIEAAKIKSAK